MNNYIRSLRLAFPKTYIEYLKYRNITTYYSSLEEIE